jgi:hypothetical protein
MNPNNNMQDEIILAEVAATTERTASWDTNGKGSWATLRIILSPGLTTDAVAPTISLLSSDDTVVTNHATITADKTIAIAGTNRAIQRYDIDLRGKKRYLRVVVTPGTVASDDAVAVSAVGTIHNMRSGPASTTDMVHEQSTAYVSSVVVL